MIHTRFTTAACLTMLCLVGPALGQISPSQLPPGIVFLPAEANRPLLQELDMESRSLYAQVRQGIVRVDLPASRPSDDPLTRWNNQLSPEVRDRLGAGEASTRPADHGPALATQPSTFPAGAMHVTLPEPLQPDAVGIVVDDRGHVLIPIYIPPPTDPRQPIHAWTGAGVSTSARFVGSDRQTNITVLQVDAQGLAPLRLGRERPEDGSLVMAFPVDSAQARISLWVSGSSDNAVIARMDGSIAGFARHGQFLCAATCAPVVHQLIVSGKVERAYLGVRVKAHLPPAADPVHPGSGASVLQVLEVIPGSVAARAGMRENDLIVSLAGQDIDNPAAFAAAIADLRGQTQLGILRDGHAITIDIDLEPITSKSPLN